MKPVVNNYRCAHAPDQRPFVCADCARPRAPSLVDDLRAALDERDAIIASMREALEPFAKVAPAIDVRMQNSTVIAGKRRARWSIRAGDVRRAAKLCE